MILDLWHDERLDDSERLGFTIPANDPKHYLLAVDHEVRWRGRRFYVTEIEDNRAEAATVTSVECNALWYRLADPTYVGSLDLAAVTTAAGLATILDGTGWTVGVQTTAAPELFSMEQQDATRLALVRAWARVTGTLVVFNTDEKTVELVTERGADRGVSFRYRRNLRRIRRRVRPPAATVLYPYGADGLTVAGLNGGSESIDDFSFYTAQGLTLDEARARFTRSRVWSDSTFIVDADLLAGAQLRLAELAAADVRYEMDVVDLSELTGITEAVSVGDTVRVVDEILGANLTTTVVRRRQYPLQPWRDEVELGTLPDVLATSARSSRPASSNDWQMFTGDNDGLYIIRNDATWTTGRIPLRFRNGGQAHYHLDFFATGRGAGTLVAQVYDATAAAVVHRSLSIPYTDGAEIHGTLQWADFDLAGGYDYRVRFSTVASGGPGVTKGVDIETEAARFFVLALGAVQETPPPGELSQAFAYTGAVQTFTVPDNVTEIHIEAKGASGGIDGGFSATSAPGGTVSARFPVTPGAVLDVYVGGQPIPNAAGGGWPDGGNGDTTTGDGGTGGGGSSRVIPTGGAIGSALIVAGAGGGQGDGFSSYLQAGGAAGFFQGLDAPSGLGAGGNCPGSGASIYAGGAGGIGTEDNGQAGTLGQGGRGGNMSSSFGFPPGGGGGGYYGGGGGGANLGAGAGTGGGGGGGSGYVRSDATEVLFSDASNTGHGAVVISWDDPDV